MSQSHDSITQVGSSITTTINNGSISSNSTLAVASDGYLSIVATDGAVAVVADGGDLTLSANNTGDDVVLTATSTGEVAVRATLKQYGTNGAITINNSSIAGSGAMTMTASNGLATVSGLTGTVITSGTGDVTLSGTNILISGELDTSSGSLTIKGNNGSSDVNITAPIATGRAGQPGLTATGGSSSANGITVTGGSTNGNGIVSTASGTGTGVHAVSSTGYGLIAETDTVEPTTTAFRIVPQDKDASSSPAAGDIYVSSKSGLISAARSDGYWGRVVTKVVAPHFAITESIDSDTTENIVRYDIPSNAVRQGSTIRIFMSGNATSAVGLPQFAIYVDGVAGSFSQQITNNTNRFRMDSVMTVREVGSSGIIQASTSFDVLNLSTYSNRFFEDTYSPVNTTNGVSIIVLFGAAEGGANITISQFVIDITD